MLIERNNLRILQAEEGYMLKDKNNDGETLEDVLKLLKTASVE
mgnify:CR=1 FL=1